MCFFHNFKNGEISSQLRKFLPKLAFNAQPTAVSKLLMHVQAQTLDYNTTILQMLKNKC